MIEVIPQVKDALVTPWEFELTLSVSGWSLSYVGSQISLLVTMAEATEIVKAFDSH